MYYWLELDPIIIQQVSMLIEIISSFILLVELMGVIDQLVYQMRSPQTTTWIC